MESVFNNKMDDIVRQAQMILAQPTFSKQYMFQSFDQNFKGYLNAEQTQALYTQIRQDGCSIQQVKAAISYTCIDSEVVEEEDLVDVLAELDRRYFLTQDFRWEFSLLSGPNKDTIPEQQAKWLMQTVHGHLFSVRKWDTFLASRPVPGTEVSFSEIEVELCNIPSCDDLLKDNEDIEQEAEARLRQKAEQLEKARRAAEKRKAEKKRLKTEMEAAEQRKQQQLLQERNQEEERLRKTREAEDEEARKVKEASDDLKEALEREKQAEEKEVRRLAELARQQEEELRAERERYQNAEEMAAEAARQEKETEKELLEAMEQKQKAKEERDRQAAGDREIAAKKKLKEIRRNKIRQDLKVAIKARDRYKLEPAIRKFEEEKLEDKDMDLEKAKKILKELFATDGLREAISKRQLDELEKAINFVRKHGFEPQLASEMIEANKLLGQLRRLERIRYEILELKQSTVAEIRSYQSPPQVVHAVMIATFLLHGHKEKETKNWKAVQALVGKTGKESLKRRCLEFKPSDLELGVAKQAQKLISTYELEDVRDVSAGAATFYCWATGMIEEALALAEAKKTKAKRELDESARKKAEGATD